MSFSVTEATPLADTVRVTEDELIVALLDGRTISVPLVWFPRLLHASREQRMNFELIGEDRKSTRLNSSHGYISYAVFCLKKKNKNSHYMTSRPHQTSPTTSSLLRT